jgi:hypothetical protein
VSDLPLRLSLRAASADPDALVETLQALARLDPALRARLQAGAHVGLPLAEAVLGAPWEPPETRGEVKLWLIGLWAFGSEACVQAAVAAAALRGTPVHMGHSRSRAFEALRQELSHWCECPCVDHVRGVEIALQPCVAYRLPGEALERTLVGWAGLSVSRRHSPSLAWSQLWRRRSCLSADPGLLRERIRRALSLWVLRSLPL